MPDSILGPTEPRARLLICVGKAGNGRHARTVPFAIVLIMILLLLLLKEP